MDKLKKTRTVVRSALTRSLAVFQQELEEETPLSEDVEVSFLMVEAKAKELEDLEQQITSAMVDNDASEDEFNSEYETSSSYTVKYLRAKVQYNLLHKVTPRHLVLPPPAQTSHVQATEVVKHKFKLPKIDIVKFGGDVKDWLPFWSQYKKIHEDNNISPEDKFQYLTQTMVPGSRAQDLVNSYPPTNENYEKVISSLKSRFGKHEMLIEVYVRELLKLMLNKTIKSNDIMSLSSLYDKLETHLRSLESLGVTKDKFAPMLYPLIESSLPEELLPTWQRFHSTVSSENLKDKLSKLMSFLQTEVENEERICIALDGFSSTNGSTARESRKKKITNNIPTAAGLLALKDSKIVCIFCADDHHSSSCEKAKRMSQEERQELVKKNNCCFGCLKPGHNYKKCKGHQRCPWCNKKHVLLMCRDMATNATGVKKELLQTKENQNKETNLANLSLYPEVFLQTLCVRLRNGDKELTVRAVFDSGSQRSYILNQAVHDIGYDAIEQLEIVHLLFGGSRTKPQKHSSYLVHLSSLDNSYSCNFTVLDQDTICAGISSIKRGPWMQELASKKIKLTDFGTTKAAANYRKKA